MAVDWSHFLVAALGGLGVVLANVILALVRARNGKDRRPEAADPAIEAWRAAMMVKVDALTESGKSTRAALHSIREDILQPLVTRVALIERDVLYLKNGKYK